MYRNRDYLWEIVLWCLQEIRETERKRNSFFGCFCCCCCGFCISFVSDYLLYYHSINSTIFLREIENKAENKEIHWIDWLPSNQKSLQSEHRPSFSTSKSYRFWSFWCAIWKTLDDDAEILLSKDLIDIFR